MFNSSETYSNLCESKQNTANKRKVNSIIKDLQTLNKQLNYEYIVDPLDQKTHDKKIRSALTDLEIIDNQLVNILQLEHKDNDLTSKFGSNIKLDVAQNKLKLLKEKHSTLNVEWYSQREHIKKISNKISKKENEIKYQNSFCTYQGLILGKILWKLSQKDYVLNNILSNEELLLEVIKVLSGCLCGLIQAYNDNNNKKQELYIDEYQFILCLLGLFSNLATTPDGRYFLISQPTCLNVFNYMITILPNVLLPDAEALKWLILLSIYNTMTCQEGESYMRSNESIVSSLAECTKSPNSNRIILLALKIIDTLFAIPCKNSKKYDCKYLPLKDVQKLQQKYSEIIRKQANKVYSSLIAVHSFSKPSQYESPIECGQSNNMILNLNCNEKIYRDAMTSYEIYHNKNDEICKLNTNYPTLNTSSSIIRTVSEKPLPELSASVLSSTSMNYREHDSGRDSLNSALIIDPEKFNQSPNVCKELELFALSDGCISKTQDIRITKDYERKSDTNIIYNEISTFYNSFQTIEQKKILDRVEGEHKNDAETYTKIVETNIIQNEEDKYSSCTALEINEIENITLEFKDEINDKCESDIEKNQMENSNSYQVSEYFEIKNAKSEEHLNEETENKNVNDANNNMNVSCVINSTSCTTLQTSITENSQLKLEDENDTETASCHDANNYIDVSCVINSTSCTVLQTSITENSQLKLEDENDIETASCHVSKIIEVKNAVNEEYKNDQMKDKDKTHIEINHIKNSDLHDIRDSIATKINQDIDNKVDEIKGKYENILSFFFLPGKVTIDKPLENTKQSLPSTSRVNNGNTSIIWKLYQISHLRRKKIEKTPKYKIYGWNKKH